MRWKENKIFFQESNMILLSLFLSNNIESTMSTLFSTIRSLSFQNDEIQRKKLSHTLSFHFHDDDSKSSPV